MWRFLANGPSGIAIAKALKHHMDTKRDGKRAAAERALMKKEDALVKSIAKAAAAAARAAQKKDKEDQKAALAAEAAKKAEEEAKALQKQPLIAQIKVLARSELHTTHLTAGELKQLKALTANKMRR